MPMSADDRKNPFTTGSTKAMPPHLAGRDGFREQFDAKVKSLLRNWHDQKRSIKHNHPPPKDDDVGRDTIIMHGPRGNGKDHPADGVLRHSRQQRFPGQTWPHLHIVHTSVSPTTPAQKILELLLNEDIAKKGASSTVSKTIRGWIEVGSKYLGKFGIEGTKNMSEERLLDHAGDILAARSRERPLVLLLDEAHALPGEQLAVLLNAINDANLPKRKGGHGQVLAILSGTPGVVLTAREAVTYSERFKFYDVDLLNRADAADALTVPMDERGMGYDSGVIEKIVGESQGYPFFLQTWGEAIWDAVVEGASQPGAGNDPVVGEDAYRAAKPVVDGKREQFYLRRYEDLEKDGLLIPAALVAHKFADLRKNHAADDGPVQCTPSELREALADVGRLAPAMRSKEPIEIIHGLVRQGYIWVPEEAGGHYVAGIPSLMDYTNENTVDMLHS